MKITTQTELREIIREAEDKYYKDVAHRVAVRLGALPPPIITIRDMCFEETIDVTSLGVNTRLEIINCEFIKCEFLMVNKK